MRATRRQRAQHAGNVSLTILSWHDSGDQILSGAHYRQWYAHRQNHGATVIMCIAPLYYEHVIAGAWVASSRVTLLPEGDQLLFHGF